MASQKEALPGSLVSWFRRRLVTKLEALSVVKSTNVREQTLVRVSWTGRTRKVVVRTAVTQSRSRTLDEPIPPSSIDPWSTEIVNLPEKTHQLTICETCDGEKKVDCPECDASGYVACPSCGGSGTAWSSRSNRTRQLLQLQR